MLSDDDVQQSYLFKNSLSSTPNPIQFSVSPLADRFRPHTFSEFFGQKHLLSENQALRQAIETDQVPSLILWGPPGSGKTTLAHLISRYSQAAFVSFSAVVSGIPELRSIIKESIQRRRMSGQRTILFVDEIHRFNKAQQDAFLPYVERGDITLIGATTQNPSFEVIAPLLSRCIVVELYSLDDEVMGTILDRALADEERGLGKYHVTVTNEVRVGLVNYGNGDARSMLTVLEYAVKKVATKDKTPQVLDQQKLKDILQKKFLRHDKHGEEHYNLISAYIKSMRDSDPDGALYWLARMIEGGEDPKFIARRIVIFASEDIGNAQPMAIVVATAVFQAVLQVGLPEAQINLAHGTTYMASCPKSNASYVGLKEALVDAKRLGNLPVPLHLRNAVTSLMKDLRYGKGYRYVHDDPKVQTEQSHLPPTLKERKYYRLKSAGEEKEGNYKEEE